MTHHELPSTEHSPVSGSAGTSRRGLIAAAAWSVPVIAVASATPAHATSANSTLTIDVVKTSVAAGGTGGAEVSNVVVTVLDSQGRPWAGQPVSLTASPAGTTLGATTGTTDAAGRFATTLTADAAAIAGIRTVTATSDVLTATDVVTVLASNVVAMGSNIGGRLGDGTTTSRSIPVFTALVFPSPVQQTASGGAHTLYLLEDGTVWATGSGASGQLGTGGTANTSTPVQVPGLTGVTQISAADSASFALLSTGELRSWGANNLGQLGDGTTTTRTSPVAVLASAGGAALTGITQIAGATQGARAVTSVGQVLAWGSNRWAQLGNGMAGDSTTPNPVPSAVLDVGGAPGSTLSNVRSVSTGTYTSYAVLTSGEAVAWGNAAVGALGNGTSESGELATSPVYILDESGTAHLTGVVQVGGAHYSGAALRTNGQVYTFGSAINGELGTGSFSMHPLPVAVYGVGGAGVLTSVVEIAGGGTTYYARLSDGSVVAWGGDVGSLGNGSTSSSSTPVVVTLPSGRTARKLGSSGRSQSTTSRSFGSIVLTP